MFVCVCVFVSARVYQQLVKLSFHTIILLDISLCRRDREDDLADEIEAIRLAADLTSRRLMAEQKGGTGGTTSSSASSRARYTQTNFPPGCMI